MGPEQTDEERRFRAEVRAWLSAKKNDRRTASLARDVRDRADLEVWISALDGHAVAHRCDPLEPAPDRSGEVYTLPTRPQTS